MMRVDADGGRVERESKIPLGKLASGVSTHACGIQLCKINPDLELSELKGNCGR